MKLGSILGLLGGGLMGGMMGSGGFPGILGGMLGLGMMKHKKPDGTDEDDDDPLAGNGQNYLGQLGGWQ